MDRLDAAQGFSARWLYRVLCGGLLYVDFISWEGVVQAIGGREELYAIYLSKIADILRNGFSNLNISVLKKYIWLFDKYIAAIERVEKLPDSHAWCKRNPELREDILLLPRFAFEASQARNAISQKS
jgi:hypothetical protein